MIQRPFTDTSRAVKPDPQSAEEKAFMSAALNVKRLCPFFYAALCVIPRLYTDQISGMKVSADKLYINRRYILSLSVAEVTGVILHEMFHILMSHRERGSGKEPSRWNRACDLYIAKCMQEAFGVIPGKGSIGLIQSNKTKIFLEMPESLPFEMDVDVKRDTPEILYLREEEDDTEHEYNISSGETGGTSGKTNDQGNKGEDNKGVKPKEGDIQSKHEKEGQLADISAEAQESQFGNGTGYEEPLKMDITDDEDSVKGTFRAGYVKEHLMRKIKDLYENSEDAICGRGTAYEDILLSFLEEKPPRNIRWHNLLDSKLTSIRIDEKSLSHPDRRFVHRGIYLEGEVVNEEYLGGVKICVDTSASMKDSDIEMSLKQVKRLLDQYDMKAELVYWDEEIENILPFENRPEFRRVKKFVKGRGGTNPECLFQYFQAKEKPLLILVFTDGQFHHIQEKYARQYNKETIWILSGANSVPIGKFNPGFGEAVRGDNAI